TARPNGPQGRGYNKIDILTVETAIILSIRRQIARRSICERHLRFLSFVDRQKNDRRSHRRHPHPVRRRSLARQSANFSRARLDQRLLRTLTRARPASLAYPHLPARH